ncbi:heavy-metal-associated domain-containing protein [uncultured Polaribacter sp.]|uniref:heavy-metal-associated domain-containing protein n=1 Tax=uncultured Polaribacter sp. TaxID=174711 RepID=UPI002632B213|nr:heavy-metal-associated domain-containing protein [uncultured Polaribacter sp.]
MTTTAIQIENLKCGGCAATIKKEILTIENVKEVSVNVDKSLVIITQENADLGVIKEKLSKLGYPEVGHKNTIVHKAKSFVSCAIGKMDG